MTTPDQRLGENLRSYCSWIGGSDKDHLKAAESFIAPLLKQARSRLVEYGLPAENLSVNIIKGFSSRAGTVVSEAGVHHCGTILVGRRGLSKVQEFFMGSVSFVIRMA